MLDVKFIRENLELVEKSAKEKGYKIDIKEILELDDKRKKELTEVELLRQKRNEIAAQMKGGKPESELIEAGKAIKRELAEKEEKLTKIVISYKLMPFEKRTNTYLDIPLVEYLKNNYGRSTISELDIYMHVCRDGNICIVLNSRGNFIVNPHFIYHWS